VRDTVNMRKLGIPAVGMVHDKFEALAKLTLRQLGEPDLPVICYKQDLPGFDTADEISSKAGEVAGTCEHHIVGE